MNQLIAQIEKILALGTAQVTLTHSQVTRLLSYARRTASKTRDKDTQRIRLASYRAASELRAVSDRLEKERKQ